MFCSFTSHAPSPYINRSLVLLQFNLPVGVFTLKGGNKGEAGNDTIIDNLELMVNAKSRPIMGRAKSRKDDLAVANDIKV